jgi:hypothetical protein
MGPAFGSLEEFRGVSIMVKKEKNLNFESTKYASKM